MHLSLPEGERQDIHGELNQFEKLRSNSTPLRQYVVSKISWIGHQFDFEIPLSNFPSKG